MCALAVNSRPTVYVDPFGLTWNYPTVDPETGTIPDDIPEVIPLDAPDNVILRALDEVDESILERERVFEEHRRRGTDDDGHWERIRRERECRENLFRQLEELRRIVPIECPEHRTSPYIPPPVLYVPRPWIPPWIWTIPSRIPMPGPWILIDPLNGSDPNIA